MGAPMGAPMGGQMGAPMGGMGMQPYNHQMAQMSQQMAHDINATVTKSTNNAMKIVVISIVASVVLGILVTVLTFLRAG
jgi:hypothetical protein